MDDFICVVIVHVSSHEESNKDSSLFKKNTSNVLTDFFSRKYIRTGSFCS